MKDFKLNWGHIIQAIALCVVGYFTYAGIAYMTGGNVILSAVVTLLVIVQTYLLMAMLQVKKVKSGKTFNVLFYVAPVLFVILMIPSIHFVSLFNHQDYIKQEYAGVIDAVNNMFRDYEDYVDDRVNDYHLGLRDVVKNKSNNVELYEQCGFENYKDTLFTQNLVHTLHTHLMGNNYSNLRGSVVRWSRAIQSENFFNIRLMSDINNLENQIIMWHDYLCSLSNDRVVGEELVVKEINTFDKDNRALNRTLESIDDIKYFYGDMGLFSIFAIIVVVVLYCMLLLPYFLIKNDDVAEVEVAEPEIKNEEPNEPVEPAKSRKNATKKPKQSRPKTAPAVADDDALDKTQIDNKAGVEEVYSAPQEPQPQDEDDDEMEKTRPMNEAEKEEMHNYEDIDDFEDFDTNTDDEDETEVDAVAEDEEDAEDLQYDNAEPMSDEVEESEFDDFDDFEDYDDTLSASDQDVDESAEETIKNIDVQPNVEASIVEPEQPMVDSSVSEDEEKVVEKPVEEPRKVEPRPMRPKKKVDASTDGERPKKKRVIAEAEDAAPKKKVKKVVKKVSEDGEVVDGEPRVRKVKKVVRKPQSDAAADNEAPTPVKAIKYKPIVYKAPGAEKTQSSESVSTFKKNN